MKIEIKILLSFITVLSKSKFILTFLENNPSLYLYIFDYFFKDFQRTKASILHSINVKIECGNSVDENCP